VVGRYVIDKMVFLRRKTNYEKSNAITRIDFSITTRMELLAVKILKSKSTERRQKLSTWLMNRLCRASEIAPVKVKISSKKQYHKKTKGRTVFKQYGYYKPQNKYIYINNRTAVQGKPLAPKTFLDTLLHEWLHHYDHERLGLNSIHTAGFYARLKDLKQKIGYFSLDN